MANLKSLLLVMSLLVGALQAQADCLVQTISCGETKMGELSLEDCPLGDGTVYDYFVLHGSAGTKVTFKMSSTSVDSVLILENPRGETVVRDDNSGGGLNSQIVHQLASSGDWVILVNTAVAEQTGNYSLSLSCETPALPGGPFLTTAELPNFRFKVRINDSITGTKVANCPSETLCVSGAIASRSELFLRIVGPKPNGLLWPNVIKFSTSKIEVWIQQISSGSMKYYQLPAAEPASSDLTGLFDRNGFQP